MERKQFRFKKDYFQINGHYNIPGFIICGGHGYNFKTFCCSNCGELFVVDLEFLHSSKTNLKEVCKGKTCPICESDMQICLVNYPENIFYNNTLLINGSEIDKENFDKTELVEVYVLN